MRELIPITTMTIALNASTPVKLTGAPVRASLIVNPSGSNNNLIWIAKLPGTYGNSLKVQYVDPSANSRSLSFQWNEASSTLLVSLATNGSGTITTTAAQLLEAAIQSYVVQSVFLVAASDSTLSGTVAAVASQTLSGGAEATGYFKDSAVDAIEFMVTSADDAYVRWDGVPADATAMSLVKNTLISWTSSQTSYSRMIQDLSIIAQANTPNLRATLYKRG